MTDTLEQKLDRIQELNRQMESASVERDLLLKEVEEYMKAIGYKLVPDNQEGELDRLYKAPSIYPGLAAGPAYTIGTSSSPIPSGMKFRATSALA